MEREKKEKKVYYAQHHQHHRTTDRMACDHDYYIFPENNIFKKLFLFLEPSFAEG